MKMSEDSKALKEVCNLKDEAYKGVKGRFMPDLLLQLQLRHNWVSAQQKL